MAVVTYHPLSFCRKSVVSDRLAATTATPAAVSVTTRDAAYRPTGRKISTARWAAVGRGSGGAGDGASSCSSTWVTVVSVYRLLRAALDIPARGDPRVGASGDADGFDAGLVLQGGGSHEAAGADGADH